MNKLFDFTAAMNSNMVLIFYEHWLGCRFLRLVWKYVMPKSTLKNILNMVLNLFKSKEVIKWWERRRFKFNIHAISSGVICLVILYLLSLYLKHGIYFFFMIPECILYLAFLNFIYLAGWYLFELVAINVRISNNTDEKRLRFFNLLVWVTYLLNLMVLLLYLTEFRML